MAELKDSWHHVKQFPRLRAFLKIQKGPDSAKEQQFAPEETAKTKAVLEGCP